MNSDIHAFDLRPNKLLLDGSFEGYKLSLDRIPTYRKCIASGVHRCQAADNQFSFYHVKKFALHNHLHVNYKKRNCIYYVDECCKVYKIMFSSLSHEILLEEVFDFGHLYVRQCGNYNASIVFPSSDIVLLCPGNGALYLIKVAEVEGKEVWHLLIPESLLNEQKATNLIDAQFAIVGNDRFLHVILLEIEEKEKCESSQKGSSLFESIVKWRCFSEGKESTWPEKYLKTFSVDGNVDYIALENGCQCLHLVCDKHPVWLQDSEHAIQEQEPSQLPNLKKTYYWTQTDKELTLWLPVAETVTKPNIHVSFNDLRLGVKVDNINLIDANFFHRIDAGLGVWCLEKSKLEIQMTKHEPGLMWRTLFLDDDRGEQMTDSSIVQMVHQKLSHLTSDNTQANVSDLPPFNTQELEDCDAPICHSSSLIRLDGMHHNITHEVNLSSSQWLFKVHCHFDETPAICTRHDVDACVWQFKACSESEKTWPHEHLATFNALGYVQASKTHKKFLVSSSNFSYVAICETSHRIYIYRQPTLLTSELKNRSTGRKVKTISKQQLINLETNEEILGVHATDLYLYVLLENSITVLAINE